MFAPTLDAVAARGLLVDVDVVHLDRATTTTASATTAPFAISVRSSRRFDRVARRTRSGTNVLWSAANVGRSSGPNSWLSNFGQLRRNTDRFSIHWAAALDLAVTLILTVKLVKWANRWNG
ncbi:MAG TPA: hypothetical protein VIJ34_10135 [Acidimicrobiales bacterium]